VIVRAADAAARPRLHRGAAALREPMVSITSPPVTRFLYSRMIPSPAGAIGNRQTLQGDSHLRHRIVPLRGVDGRTSLASGGTLVNPASSIRTSGCQAVQSSARRCRWGGSADQLGVRTRSPGNIGRAHHSRPCSALPSMIGRRAARNDDGPGYLARYHDLMLATGRCWPAPQFGASQAQTRRSACGYRPARPPASPVVAGRANATAAPPCFGSMLMPPPIHAGVTRRAIARSSPAILLATIGCPAPAQILPSLPKSVPRKRIQGQSPNWPLLCQGLKLWTPLFGVTRMFEALGPFPGQAG
jgi:hypothetical protein